MAHKYVWSAAAGAGTGADWVNAYTSLKAAAEAAGTAAGDNIWVADDHADTSGSAETITSKNTAAAPGTIICVNRGGTVPPVAADLRATATVTTTAGSTLSLNCGGGTYVYGLILSAGTGAVTSGLSVTGVAYLKSCVLAKAGTTASASAVSIGASNTASSTILDNTSVTFGAVGDSFLVVGTGNRWLNTAVPISGAVIPTSKLFGNSGSNVFSLVANGVDFSQLAGATPLIAPGQPPSQLTLINCILKAASIIWTVPTSAGSEVVLINCDSGDTNYRNERYRYEGVQSTETVIVRTGGATDGTTPISWKIVSTANAKLIAPFESLPITVWSDTVGAKTVSLYGYWNNAAVPTNAQIWMVAEYLGTAGFPISSFVSSGPATVLTAGGNIPSDTSTWGGGDATTRFKMSVDMITTKKGPITVRVYVAAATNTFYIDPKIEIV